jgi:hypothetical protein
MTQTSPYLLFTHRLLFTRSAFLLAGVLAGTIAGCTGSQVGEESAIVCQPVVREALTREEESALGFAPGPLIDHVAGVFTGPMAWADGMSTPATLTVTDAGGPYEFQDREWVGDGLTAAIGDCNDVVSVTLDVELRSEDGALAEVWQVAVLAEVATEAATSIDASEFVGTLDLARFAPSTGDLESHLMLHLRGTDATVAIDGLVSRVEGETASATFFDVGDMTATRAE